MGLSSVKKIDKNNNVTINYRFLFTTKDGKQTAIYLGNIAKKEAEYQSRFIENLVDVTKQRDFLKPETMVWLNRIPSNMKEKLINNGLLESKKDDIKKTITLGKLVDRFLNSPYITGSIKTETKNNIKVTMKKLTDYFGNDKTIDSITAEDVIRLQNYLYNKKKENGKKCYAESSVTRWIKRFRHLLSWYLKQDDCCITKNVFSEMKTKGNMTNKTRTEYISKDTVAKLLSVCKNTELRFAIFLARYLGLRIPSECISLHWKDISFGGKYQKVTIHGKQTKSEDDSIRDIPIFECIRPFLVELFYYNKCDSFIQKLKEEGIIDIEQCLKDFNKYDSFFKTLFRDNGSKYVSDMVAKYPAGQDFVFSASFRQRKSRSNQIAKLKAKAKVSFQKNFQNLRVSFEMDLLQEGYNESQVMKWLGHTKEVSIKHYQSDYWDNWDTATGCNSSNSSDKIMLKSLLEKYDKETIEKWFSEFK
jgi:integrase